MAQDSEGANPMPPCARARICNWVGGALPVDIKVGQKVVVVDVLLLMVTKKSVSVQSPAVCQTCTCVLVEYLR